MLCIYSTTANITIAYNLGAIGGVMLGLQIASGVLVAMTYVASDDQSFATLDVCTAPRREEECNTFNTPSALIPRHDV